MKCVNNSWISEEMYYYYYMLGANYCHHKKVQHNKPIDFACFPELRQLLERLRCNNPSNLRNLFVQQPSGAIQPPICNNPPSMCNSQPLPGPSSASQVQEVPLTEEALVDYYFQEIQKLDQPTLNEIMQYVEVVENDPAYQQERAIRNSFKLRQQLERQQRLLQQQELALLRTQIHEQQQNFQQEQQLLRQQELLQDHPYSMQVEQEAPAPEPQSIWEQRIEERKRLLLYHRQQLIQEQEEFRQRRLQQRLQAQLQQENQQQQNAQGFNKNVRYIFVRRV